MTRKLIALAFGVLLSSTAMAQEYGLAVGIHQTSASVDNTTGSSGKVEGKLGFEAGLAVAFELIPNLRFRTGLTFDQRQFDYKISGNKFQFNYAYLDVPVNAQYNFTPMFGVFGGLLVGIKASDSTKVPSGMTLDADMKSLYPLIDLGVNMTFDDMIGFDVYYERGIGEFASATGLSLKDYSTFGLRFLYWM